MEVRTFDGFDVTTNTRYIETFTFPSRAKRFHKVLAVFKLKCHSRRGCGVPAAEWDHMVQVYIIENTEFGRLEHPIEILRYITPYGGGFRNDWMFSWTVDLTDYADLLRDEVIIRWDNARDKAHGADGNITLTFYMTEGTPIREFISVHHLPWGGGRYGDPSAPIGNKLRDSAYTAPASAASARLKVYQTGHGFGGTENCAEACSKQRVIHVNNRKISERDIWRKSCGYNPVYPQAGTWLFKRANWCPGELAWPDDYDFEVIPNTDYALEMDMQEYVNRRLDRVASYNVRAQLFFYGAAAFTHDVSVEEIITPSTQPYHRRYNPTCGEPIIVIRNNGSEVLTSATIEYGIENETSRTYTWTGSLGFLRKDTIRLPGALRWARNIEEATFTARIFNPNGEADEYALNDALTSDFIAPLTLDFTEEEHYLEIFVQTNSSSRRYNWYQVYDVTRDEVIHENRDLREIEYAELVPVTSGYCYRFLFSNEGADIELAPNLVSVPPDFSSINDRRSGFRDGLIGGSLSLNSSALQPSDRIRFPTNFGNRIVYYFTANGGLAPPLPPPPPLATPLRPEKQSLLIFRSNPARESVQLQASKPMERLTIIDVAGAQRHSKTYAPHTRDYTLSTAAFPSGTYVVRVVFNDGSEVNEQLIIE